MTPGDALDAALRVRVESTARATSDAAGGYAKAARIALGIEGRLPPKGSAERLAYDTARQTFTRYAKGVRGAKPDRKAVALFRRAADQLTLSATRARAASFRGGCRMKLTALVSDDTPNMRRASSSRTRTMPSGGHGQELTGNGAWIDAYLGGEVELAGELLIDAFLTAYDAPDIDVTDVDEITLNRKDDL